LRILAFETSAKAASAAVLQDGLLLGEYYQNSGQTHSRTVMKLAEDLLDNCDLTVRDLDAVAVAMGPGSFTGVRIGMAAAKGLSWGGELPVYGISTLEAMAWLHGETERIIIPAMDARRSQAYCAAFLWENGTLQRLMPDSALSFEALLEEIKKWEKGKILVGDGALLCYNTYKHVLSDIVLAPEHLRHQRASGVALAAFQRIQSADAGEGPALVPNYLRLSQAERERLEKGLHN